MKLPGDPRGAGDTARFYKLGAEQVAALTSPEREAYARHRAAFEREVADLVRHAAEHGWIDVGTKGRVVKFQTPNAARRRA
jgi:hypothetical protein